MRSHETRGRRSDRADCMRKFKEAWTKFAADEANLTMFLAEKRRASADSQSSVGPLGAYASREKSSPLGRFGRRTRVAISCA
jgi:hypothetical protein